MIERDETWPIFLWVQLCLLAETRLNQSLWTWEHYGTTPTRGDMKKPGYRRFELPDTYA